MPGTVAQEQLDRLDTSGYALEVEDTFDGPRLNRRLWLPYYLPHWSSREGLCPWKWCTGSHLIRVFGLASE
ncbi:hypothetical protein MTQ10_14085 [Streptomyces sp. XM83C]|uniref:hypothetical protein n=1 Tax=Streptomyces sp. XM83C TaxID=2929781 RepID=UPI001FF93AA2|nr:hypothetical protein [Streptomyces sp. XM83C]MCK1820710.1 hypothetical protein [Streptomyces sp. XM83C]